MSNNEKIIKKIIKKINKKFSGKRISSFIFVMDYYQLIEEDGEFLTIYSDVRIYKKNNNENIFSKTEYVQGLIGRKVVGITDDREDYIIELEGNLLLKFKMYGPVDGGIAGDFGGEF